MLVISLYPPTPQRRSGGGRLEGQWREWPPGVAFGVFFCLPFFDQKIDPFWGRVLEAFGLQNGPKIAPKSIKIASQDSLFFGPCFDHRFCLFLLIFHSFCKIFNFEKSVFCIVFCSTILTSVFSNGHVRAWNSLDMFYLIFTYFWHGFRLKIDKKQASRPDTEKTSFGIVFLLIFVWFWGPSGGPQDLIFCKKRVGEIGVDRFRCPPGVFLIFCASLTALGALGAGFCLFFKVLPGK